MSEQEFVHSNENENVNTDTKAEDTAVSHKGKRASGKSSTGKKTISIIAIVLAGMVLLCAGFSVWAVYGYKNTYPGVSFAGADFSYLNEDQVKTCLDKMNDDMYKGKTIPVIIDGKTFEISADEISASIDKDMAANEIMQCGRQGGIAERFSTVVSAYFNGCAVEGDTLSVDEGKLNEKVAEIASETNKDGEKPSYKIEGDILRLDLGSLKTYVDEQELTAVIEDRLAKADFSEFEYAPVTASAGEVNIKWIKNAIECEAKDAYLDLENDPTGETISPHQDGIELDESRANDIISKSNGERVLEIPIKVTPAKITTEFLKEVLFRDVLADVTTSLNPGLVSRTSNVRLATSFVNGVILNPGEEFSYNKVVGPRTYERGFKDALVFQQGEIVDGTGGGICQVSSTLYMATLRADLKVTARRNHQFVVSYTKLGEDATVVYGSQDYKFINDSEYPIKIVAALNGSKLNVVFMGTKTQNKEVKLETTVLSRTPYERKTIEDPSIPPGKSKVKSEGHTGYKTQTYRIVYIDGKEVSRTLENTSTYIKLDHVILVSPGSTSTVTPEETTAPPEQTTGSETAATGSGETSATTPPPPQTETEADTAAATEPASGEAEQNEP